MLSGWICFTSLCILNGTRKHLNGPFQMTFVTMKSSEVDKIKRKRTQCHAHLAGSGGIEFERGDV